MSHVFDEYRDHFVDAAELKNLMVGYAVCVHEWVHDNALTWTIDDLRPKDRRAFYELSQLRVIAAGQTERDLVALPTERLNQWLVDAHSRDIPEKRDIDSRLVELHPDLRALKSILESSHSAEDKMEQICEKYPPAISLNSVKWARLLGVKGPAIRKTDFWIDRREHKNAPTNRD